MSLFLLLNPKQYPSAVVVKDTSDILDVHRKRRRREEEELEEAIAAQLLQARQEDVVIPASVDTDRLREALQAKLSQPPAPGEVVGPARNNRIRVLLLILLMED